LLADETINDIMVNGHNQVYIERRGKLELTDVKFRDDRHVMNVATRIVSQIGRRVDESSPLVDARLADGSRVNAADAIFIERRGRLHLTEARFMTPQHVRQVIEKIVAAVGRRIDESSPLVDARLADGSRVNAVIPPLAVDGPMLTIRKFAKTALTANDLVKAGTLTDEAVGFLGGCVRSRRNILISGGTGSGKTTLLNIVSSFIPEHERIVTIEDAVELRLHQRHVIRLEARPANVEGKGQISIRQLVHNSLRMRPDRIVVGEVRGGEAFDMLQAMNTGHEGSLSTLHANTPKDALARLETMVLMAGLELPARSIREQIASALDLVVHLSRMGDGSRRITEIAEVTGIDDDAISLSTLFSFDHLGDQGAGGPGNRPTGALRPTGVRPRFVDDQQRGDIDVADDLDRAFPELPDDEGWWR
ncbi:MAG: CpaF family protein, partial [Acidimicrobiales bacterium]